MRVYLVKCNAVLVNFKTEQNLRKVICYGTCSGGILVIERMIQNVKLDKK